MANSACSVSFCELTETNSPPAIDSAPATTPARPATSSCPRVADAPATPMTRPAVERIPSLAPRTAARNQLSLDDRLPPEADSFAGWPSARVGEGFVMTDIFVGR